MRYSILLLILATALQAVTDAKAVCKKPVVRKEWRMLRESEKAAYIRAVKCLARKPSQTNHVYPGARSRFDDFQATHINFTNYVHFVGFFHAWHRVFVAEYENDLRELCGYKGGQPYWDWSLDSASVPDFTGSPIFDPVTGFGGNGDFINTRDWTNVSLHIPGKTGGGCVQDGPFKHGEFQVNLGPGPSTSYNPRCLTRDVAPEFAISKLNQSVVDWTLEAGNFFEFDLRVEAGITVAGVRYHGGGHLGVGGDIGEMGDVYSSPGEPLFYLHHANMDRLWDLWQRRCWPKRKYDIGGPDTMMAYPFNFFGDKPYKNITLGYEMDFGHLFHGRYEKVRDVMDIQGGRLCYAYHQ